ncbi:hypothetical protein [Lentzea sp. NPDC004782]|uniref:hypothetical protein n=1 Tax=Lentzea sp. NPDC004782 TaxID=3154458 RepID=UPI0033A6C7E0
MSRLDVSAGQLDQIRLGRIRRNHAVEAVTVVAEDRIDVRRHELPVPDGDLRHQVDAAPQLIFHQTRPAAIYHSSAERINPQTRQRVMETGKRFGVSAQDLARELMMNTAGDAELQHEEIGLLLQRQAEK